MTPGSTFFYNCHWKHWVAYDVGFVRANPVLRLTLLLCAAMACSSSSPICLVIRDEVGQHLAQCVAQPLNHAVGLCVGAAGGSLHGPKHAGNFSADRGYELWTSVAKENV